jgi:hypothetical protein
MKGYLLRYKNGIAWALLGLGQVAHSRGEDRQAKEHLGKSLILVKQVNNQWYVTYCSNPIWWHISAR